MNKNFLIIYSVLVTLVLLWFVFFEEDQDVSNDTELVNRAPKHSEDFPKDYSTNSKKYLPQEDVNKQETVDFKSEVVEDTHTEEKPRVNQRAISVHESRTRSFKV